MANHGLDTHAGEPQSLGEMSCRALRPCSGYGEELVIEPFQRLTEERKLHAFRYDGFWQCMDTFKDKQRLDDLMDRDVAPWQVWKHPESQAE